MNASFERLGTIYSAAILIAALLGVLISLAAWRWRGQKTCIRGGRHASGSRQSTMNRYHDLG